MALGEIGPILSGLAGAAAAAWLSHRLSRWIPFAFEGKSGVQLVQHHKFAIHAANAIALAGLVGTVAAYSLAGLSRHDWRPFGVGFGFALSSPLLVLPLVSVALGKSVRECMVAYAISQKQPPLFIYSLLILGLPLFLVSLTKIMERPTDLRTLLLD